LDGGFITLRGILAYRGDDLSDGARSVLHARIVQLERARQATIAGHAVEVALSTKWRDDEEDFLATFHDGAVPAISRPWTKALSHEWDEMTDQCAEALDTACRLEKPDDAPAVV
jgi:hypothetical protein